MFTEKQVQEYLQVSRTTMWRLRRDGALPHYRVGGEVRYRRRDIEDWLESQQRIAIQAETEANRPIELDACVSRREKAWVSALSAQDWGFYHEPTDTHTHSLHPYPAKFPPPLPARLIEILTRRGQAILDPFCGSGTTLVEALRLGRVAIGLDVNPIGVLISAAKTVALDPSDFRALLDLQQAVQADAEREVGVSPLFAEALPIIDPYPPPQIPNIDRWFEPVVIRELGIVLRRLEGLPPKALCVARAALSSILVSVSNQDSETRYTAKPVSLASGDVLNRFARRLSEVSTMHEAWAVVRGSRKCRVLLADARSVKPKAVARVHAVVTSPPYANAFDYHLYHRHRMFWLGYDPGLVRDQEIGSHLNHQRERDGIASYRDDMRASLHALAQILQPGSPCAFVVGDSVFNGITVNNAHVIVEAGREAGFRCIAVADRAIHPIKRSMIAPARRARIERIVLMVRDA